MTVYTEKNWGADADGNRGISVTEYEIDDDDFDAIHEQVINYMEDIEIEEDELPSTIEITLICPHSDEDIQFEIDPKDYL